MGCTINQRGWRRGCVEASEHDQVIRVIGEYAASGPYMMIIPYAWIMTRELGSG